jgi:hypothetical protein
VSAPLSRARAVALVALVVFAVIALAGCSPQRKYKVLSFFFDGVPDPNAPKLTQTFVSLDSSDKRPVAKLAVIHKP